MSTLTVYPSAGEVSPCDGTVVRNISNPGEAWNTLRTSAGTSAPATVVHGYGVYVICATTTSQYRYLGRDIFNFDTSALGAGAVISDAVLSIYQTSADGGKADNMNMAIGVCGATPDGTDTLANGDYLQTDTTRYATDVDITSTSNDAYNDWTFNATGKAAISLTGITSLSHKLDKDIDNAAPSWTSDQAGGYNSVYADEEGTDEDPKLVITYTEAPASTRIPRGPTGGVIVGSPSII